MVCLKARKKQDDRAADTDAQISLLEIISNVQWEQNRNDVLSKISHAISKDPSLGVTKLLTFNCLKYKLEFLPRSDKPAVIPPELKSKLPSVIFSIRIKLTPKTNPTPSFSKKDHDAPKTPADYEERKLMTVKYQKKLIDKIKFAQRLRNLIIAEEQKGVVKSQFSVSREGIEKALQKYKLQLWKSYTGTTNLSVEQLQRAVKEAKTSGAVSKLSSDEKSAAPVATSSVFMNSNTMARISANQGLNVVYGAQQVSSSGVFLPVGARGQAQIKINLKQNPAMIPKTTDLVSSRAGSVNSATLSCEKNLTSPSPVESTSSAVKVVHTAVTVPSQMNKIKVRTSKPCSTVITPMLVPYPHSQVRVSSEITQGSVSVNITEPISGGKTGKGVSKTGSNNESEPESSLVILEGATSESEKVVISKPSSSVSAVGHVGSGDSNVPMVNGTSQSMTECVGALSVKNGAKGMNPLVQSNVQQFPHGKDVLLIPEGGNGQILKGQMFMVLDKDGAGAAPSPKTVSLLPNSDVATTKAVNFVGKKVPTSCTTLLNPAISDLVAKGKLKVAPLTAAETRIPSPEILNSSLRQAMPVSVPENYLTATTTCYPVISSVGKGIQVAQPGSSSHILQIPAGAVVNTSGNSATCVPMTTGNQLSAPVVYPVRRAPSPADGVCQAPGKSTSSQGPVSSCNFQVVSLPSSSVGSPLVLIPVSTVPKFIGSTSSGYVATPVAQVHTSPSKQSHSKLSSKKQGKKSVEQIQQSNSDQEVGVRKDGLPQVSVGPVCVSTGKPKAGAKDDDILGIKSVIDTCQKNSENINTTVETVTVRTVIKTSENSERDLPQTDTMDIDDAYDSVNNLLGSLGNSAKKLTTEEVDKEVDKMMSKSLHMDGDRESGKRKRESPDILDEIELEEAVKKAISGDCLGDVHRHDSEVENTGSSLPIN